MDRFLAGIKLAIRVMVRWRDPAMHRWVNILLDAIDELTDPEDV